MKKWWYASNSDKFGPIDTEDVRLLLLSEKVESKTLFWQQGMENWQPLRDIKELVSLKNVVPPPFPHKISEVINSPGMAGAWRRMLARLFDLSWTFLWVYFSLIAFLAGYLREAYDWFHNPYSFVTLAIFSGLSGLLLDAICYSITGNTPGKALLGLKVMEADSRKLSFTRYLKRNLSVFIHGMALGIPFIFLIAMFRQKVRVQRNIPASYDEKSGVQVRSRPLNVVKTAIFGLVFIISISIEMLTMSVLEIVTKSYLKEPASVLENTSTYRWVNPLTGRGVPISTEWSVHAYKEKNNQTTYLFNDSVTRDKVFLSSQEVKDITLKDYVNYAQSVDSVMRDLGSGNMHTDTIYSSWRASKALADSKGSQVDVEIIQRGSTFWRIKIIQNKLSPHSSATIGQLVSSLKRSARLTPTADEFLDELD